MAINKLKSLAKFTRRHSTTSVPSSASFSSAETSTRPAQPRRLFSRSRTPQRTADATRGSTSTDTAAIAGGSAQAATSCGNGGAVAGASIVNNVGSEKNPSHANLHQSHQHLDLPSHSLPTSAHQQHPESTPQSFPHIAAEDHRHSHPDAPHDSPSVADPVSASANISSKALVEPSEPRSGKERKLADKTTHQSHPEGNQPRLTSSSVGTGSSSSQTYGLLPDVEAVPAQSSRIMAVRKVWVKRPTSTASATQVAIHEDDLVDDVRDMVIRKYANSLGRSFDSPDVTLRICPRDQRQERVLSPDEQICRILDEYYPGKQTVEEALLIDVPFRRTPKHSPRHGVHGVPYIYHNDDLRPAENDTDYFPPMPPAIPSPRAPSAPPVQSAISVLTTGQIPTVPSPGATTRRPRRDRERPHVTRAQTSSPITSLSTASALVNNGTQMHTRIGRPRTHSSASEKSVSLPIAPPPLPTPPLSEAIQRVATPPPARPSSPRPSNRSKKVKKNSEHAVPSSLLNSSVPPISVLIVEDNIINLKLLEAFMKRLRVRWQTAMNGREAVNKWRNGGFHLVLMDIQLPVMSGLDATREIRRLERCNNIGVFSSMPSERQVLDETTEPSADDQLPNTALFKSPVIIVALTASSLQSDRHEALAAGCNDFLTKPVNFVWLERKVMEWGCMQALIDYDGWRKWKDFAQIDEGDAKKAALKGKPKKRMSLGSSGANNLTKTIKEEVEESESKENIAP